MYWVFSLLITCALSTSNFGVPAAALAPLRLFGRQDSSCTGCQEQCCAGSCIATDLACCDNTSTGDGGWCDYPAQVCQPCPEGQTCWADNIDENGNYTGEVSEVTWTCCENNVCTFILSSGSATLVTSISATSPPAAPSTITTSISSTPMPPPNPATSTSSPSPATPTSSPSPTAAAPPPVAPVTIVTVSVQTTSTLQASSISTASAFTPSAPGQTSTQTSLSLVVITSSNTATFVTSTISSSTHSPIPPWNGTGPLLVGYCATPEFSLVYGPQTTAVYFIGIVGCVGDKPDCCPFQVSSTTTTDTTTVTETVGPPTTNQFVFPTAASPSLVTLQRCPEDYETISSVCCPSGYSLWDEVLGGITPCFSSLSSYLTPPPVAEASTIAPEASTITPEASTAALSASPTRITSTVVNVVYARNYPVNATQTGLDTPAKAGIGVGVGVGALAGTTLFFGLWRWWKRRQERSRYPTGGGSPLHSGSGLEP